MTQRDCQPSVGGSIITSLPSVRFRSSRSYPYTSAIAAKVFACGILPLCFTTDRKLWARPMRFDATRMEIEPCSVRNWMILLASITSPFHSLRKGYNNCPLVSGNELVVVAHPTTGSFPTRHSRDCGARHRGSSRFIRFNRCPVVAPTTSRSLPEPYRPAQALYR